MLQQDYLLRMFTLLAAAMRDSILKQKGEYSPETAADRIEESLMNATEIDGSVLLRMAPESMVSLLQISGTDPLLIQYLSRSLLLESQYLEEAGQQPRSDLRRAQAFELAHAYGFELSDETVTPEELDRFFEETLSPEQPEDAAAQQSDGAVASAGEDTSTPETEIR